jgi:TRAP transporter 4TM/12TM fusion protein
MRRINHGLLVFTRYLAIALGFWHLALVAGWLSLSTLEIRIVHLSAMLVLAFLALPVWMRPDDVEVVEAQRWEFPLFVLRGVAALLAAASGIYLYTRWQAIALSGGMTTPTDAYVGMVVIALVMLAVVRRIGLFLAGIVGLFLIYPLISNYLPGVLQSRPFSLQRLSTFMTTTSEGIYGIPLGVSASFIIMFTIFGAFLSAFGAGEFFFRISSTVTRGRRAASAKTAVIFSSLLGLISGSAAGNVAVTGTMTIPMMKREGYKPHQAGAIEAVVSTGGQMLPPVMGAAAFIMAEILGRPYTDIMTAALIPALLFFFSIYFVVHLQALRSNITSIKPDENLAPIRSILLPGLRFVVPFGILVGMMVYGYSPFRASFIALIVLLVGCFFFEFRDLRGFFKKILDALESGTKSVVSIAVACAGAGIIAGVLAMTGLGSKISGLIITASGGEPIIALVLTMIVSIILGMGLPTTAAYLILATVVAPALSAMGIPLLTAHLFVFFYGCISTITPPVALASYVAASIAGSDIDKTSWTAFGYGIASYILPFMFYFGPALLMDGTWLEIIRSSITGLISVYCIAGAVVGYIGGRLTYAGRSMAFAAGLLLLYQSLETDIFGIAILAGLYLYTRTRVRTPADPAVSKR